VACVIPRPAAGLPGPSADGTADAGIFRAPIVADPTPDPYEVLDRLARLLRERAALEENLGRACLLLRRSGAFRRLGFARFDEYCADRLGLAPSTLRQRIALERRMQELPALREALRSGRLSYEQARLVARVATPSDVAARIEEAAARTCIAYRRELEGEEHRQMWRAGELRAMVPDEVDSLLEDALRSARASVRGLTPGEALVEVALHFIWTWKWEIERLIRAAHPVILRDGALCQVPGCSRPADHVHHVVSRAARGALEPWNEISLCAVHHLRGVHGGSVRITGTAPLGLEFTLGEREVAAARARGDGCAEVVACERHSDARHARVAAEAVASRPPARPGLGGGTQSVPHP
jgi:ribosomal protein L22